MAKTLKYKTIRILPDRGARLCHASTWLCCPSFRFFSALNPYYTVVCLLQVFIFYFQPPLHSCVMKPHGCAIL